MITAPTPRPQPGPIEVAPRWQQLWQQAVRDPHELLALLGLESETHRLSENANHQFPLRVPRGFVAKMRYGDLNDPLLRQVLPLDDEDRLAEGFVFDAVGDSAARAASGVIHKYQGRALLISTGSCAVHCRYCFRRHFPYAQETAAANHWQAAVDYLKNHPDVEELILSGGDPLSLSNAKLKELSDILKKLPQVRRLRLHTRLPIVLPERIDTEFLFWLSALPLQIVVVVHANHAQEIDSRVDQALITMRQTGATVLNQSVLLRGVNDDADALVALSERLFVSGTLPYYLHQLDRVSGAAHFEVSDSHALDLHRQIQAHLPGYLVPRLVREIAGEANKTLLL